MGKVKKLKAKVKRWKARYLGLNELCEAYQGEIKRLDRELQRVKTDYEMMKDERDSLFERLYGEPFRSAVEKLADMPRVSYLTEKETDAVLKSGNVLTIEGKPVPYGSFEEMLESIALDYDAQIEDLKFELSELDDRNTAAEGELADTLKKITVLENKLECRMTALDALRDEKVASDEYNSETIANLREEIEQFKVKNGEQADYISNLESQIQDSEEDDENLEEEYDKWEEE